VIFGRDRQTLSTARFCRAGQLATADTYGMVSYGMTLCLNRTCLLTLKAAVITNKWSKNYERPHHRARPKNCFFPWGNPGPQLKMVSWAHLSPCPKRDLDRFSRFVESSRLCPTDRHTNRRRPRYISGNRPFLCTLCMRCGLQYFDIVISFCVVIFPFCAIWYYNFPSCTSSFVKTCYFCSTLSSFQPTYYRCQCRRWNVIPIM